jgi:hypothetical protein
MSRCWLPGCLICGLLCGLFRPAPAAAFDLLGWLKGNHRSYTAMYLGGAGPDAGPAPGAPFQPGVTLFSPPYGYVPGVPSYNWGYFGAPYLPVHFCHQGYSGDCSWWHYHRR